MYGIMPPQQNSFVSDLIAGYNFVEEVKRKMEEDNKKKKDEDKKKSAPKQPSFSLMQTFSMILIFGMPATLFQLWMLDQARDALAHFLVK